MSPATSSGSLATLPSNVGEARARLEEMLNRRRWRGDLDGALIAVHEALINADRHGGGIRAVRAALDPRELVVEVADHCVDGFDPSAYVMHEPDLLAERGRGLWLISRIASSFDVLQDDEGSCFVMRFTSTDAPVPTAVPAEDLAMPAIADCGMELLDALGAAVFIVDTKLVVREVSPNFSSLFDLAAEEATGRDVRGLIAEIKGRFQDPATFEDRSLYLYAHQDEAVDDLFMLANGRPVRRRSVPLHDGEGRRVGRLNAFVAGAEDSHQVAAVQRALLPKAPSWPDLEVGAIYHPAESGAFVGGDFYDFIDLTSGGRCILVGDVSGRGTAAAAASSTVRAHLRATLGTYGVTAAIPGLEEALQREFAPEEFVTLTLCVQESRGVWTMTNCGHVPALVCSEGEVHTFRARGSLLGFGLTDEWVREPFVLRPGDVLLLYTDGVLDAGRGQERFDVERLREALLEVCHLPVQDLVEAIDERVHAFAAHHLNDDHVLLAVRHR